MFLLLKMAWRNIFRNVRRTLLTASAIGAGLAMLLLTISLSDGMIKQMVDGLIKDFTSHGQIHCKNYLKKKEATLTIPSGQTILGKLENDKRVDAFAPRLLSFGLVASSANSAGVQIMGVDPAREVKVTHFYKKLVKGKYFKNTYKREIIVGVRTAKSLKLKTGSKVVLTTASATTGDLSQNLFRVAGIFKSGNRELDAAMVLINYKVLQKMLDLPDKYHEIAILLKDAGDFKNPSPGFWDEYSKNNIEAKSWIKLQPQFAAMMEMMKFALGFLIFIVLGIVSAGIINTMFMSLFERTREFGIMRALGTSPFKLGILIIFEAGSLSVVSSVFGLALGFLASWPFVVWGVDWSGSSFSGVAITEPTKAVINAADFMTFTLIIMVSTVLIALYPAYKAMKIKPADAMRQID